MSPAATTRLPEIIRRREQDLLERWMKEQLSAVSQRRELLSESQLREQSREFLDLVAQAAAKTSLSSIDAPAWQPVRDMLGDLSRSRAIQGFTTSETATFVFSLKQPLFDLLRQEYDGQAAALDLSRVLKPGGEVSYGIALHVGGLRNEWLPDGRRPALANRMAYNLGIGPSIMMRGITASTQFGVLTNGHEALQVLSTRVSANGRLTSVRIPVSISAEKTFAFGGGPIVSRRSDALERLSASVHLLESLALNFGVSSHRITWPGERPSLDFRASEVLMTVGARYMLTW